MKQINPLINVTSFTRNTELFIKIVFFILLIVLMISQNTQHMADRMFWLNEVTTYRTAILPFWQIPLDAAVTSYQMQPPLFYWLGHLASLVGTDPITLRSVSVACYILMVGFIIFLMRELQIATRIILSLFLILLPFAEFATTEFRPYALSAFTILVSSVFLYRLLINPSNWWQSLLYGFSALTLQYSLTLNSFVFGVQMLFITSCLLVSFGKLGISESLRKYKPVIIISTLLFSQYIIFLYLVASNQPYYQIGSLVEYFEHLGSNSKVLFNSLFIYSWAIFVIFGLFISGCVFGLVFKPWVTLYLLLILAGQLIFSTYVTYASISWFSQRYLVASYVVFSLICALGAEVYFRRLGDRKSVILAILLMLWPMYSGINGYLQSRDNPMFNPSTAVIEKLRCNKHKTVVLGAPKFIGKVPWYAYRNDHSIIVPWLNNNINEVISNAAMQKHCIILQEIESHRLFNDDLFGKLSALSDYTKKRYSTSPGRHVPDSAWLFVPN